MSSLRLKEMNKKLIAAGIQLDEEQLGRVSDIVESGGLSLNTVIMLLRPPLPKKLIPESLKTIREITETVSIAKY